MRLTQKDLGFAVRTMGKKSFECGAYDVELRLTGAKAVFTFTAIPVEEDEPTNGFKRVYTQADGGGWERAGKTYASLEECVFPKRDPEYYEEDR